MPKQQSLQMAKRKVSGNHRVPRVGKGLKDQIVSHPTLGSEAKFHTQKDKNAYLKINYFFFSLKTLFRIPLGVMQVHVVSVH